MQNKLLPSSITAEAGGILFLGPRKAPAGSRIFSWPSTRSGSSSRRRVSPLPRPSPPFPGRMNTNPRRPPGRRKRGETGDQRAYPELPPQHFCPALGGRGRAGRDPLCSRPDGKVSRAGPRPGKPQYRQYGSGRASGSSFVRPSRCMTKKRENRYEGLKVKTNGGDGKST